MTLTCMTVIDRLRGIPATASSQDPRRAWRWRRDQLVAAGLDELSAYRLATRPGVDLHEVLTMTESGVSSPPVRDGRPASTRDLQRG